MGVHPAGLVSVHAALGTVEEIIGMRRAVYSAVVEMSLGPVAAAHVAVEVLDNPVVRAHLAEVLRGRVIDPRLLTSDGARLADRPWVCSNGDEVRLASSPAAGLLLAGALEHIRSQLTRHGDHARAGSLLSVEDPDFAAARRQLLAGVELAAEVVPELVRDLLPHVAAFGLVAADAAGRLGSASVRDWPGLVLLPPPRQPSEAAEALLHEGAHQKLFDLLLTRSILRPQPGPPPTFAPPWRPQPAPRWPLEQCLAALHTYTLLAAAAPLFAARGTPLHEHSLLPQAPARARTLSAWLQQHVRYLGPDGRRLLGGLSGTDPTGGDPELDAPPRSPPGPAVEPAVVRHCGGWTLHLYQQPDRPGDVWWIPAPNRDVTAFA